MARKKIQKITAPVAPSRHTGMYLMVSAIIVCLLSLIGVLSYLTWNRNMMGNQTKSSSSASQQTTNPELTRLPELNQTYTGSELPQFGFKYSNSWNLQMNGDINSEYLISMRNKYNTDPNEAVFFYRFSNNLSQSSVTKCYTFDTGPTYYLSNTVKRVLVPEENAWVYDFDSQFVLPVNQEFEKAYQNYTENEANALPKEAISYCTNPEPKYVMTKFQMQDETKSLVDVQMNAQVNSSVSELVLDEADATVMSTQFSR